MAVPKSVTKIKTKKGESYIEFVDFSDQVDYYLFELTRRALNDVAKFIKKLWTQNYYNKFVKRTGKAGKSLSSVVYSKKDTTHPRVSVGLKTGKVDGFYAYFQEFGTSKTPRLGILQNTVKDNIATIVEIESKYLSGLSGEAESLNSQINEEEYNENDD